MISNNIIFNMTTNGSCLNGELYAYISVCVFFCPETNLACRWLMECLVTVLRVCDKDVQDKPVIVITSYLLT